MGAVEVGGTVVVAEVMELDVVEIVEVLVVMAVAGNVPVLEDVEGVDGSIVGPSVALTDRVVPGGGHVSPTGQHPPPCTHV